MATYNIICNETSETVDTYRAKGPAQRRANYLAKSAAIDARMGVGPANTFRVEEYSEWAPCEIDPTAEKKDAALLARA